MKKIQFTQFAVHKVEVACEGFLLLEQRARGIRALKSSVSENLVIFTSNFFHWIEPRKLFHFTGRIAKDIYSTTPFARLDALCE